MRARVLFAVALALACTVAAYAQQVQMLTVVSDYTVRTGKEEEFTNLVKSVGGPVRDKLMAEGVIQGWGIDVPITRAPNQPTHSIWWTVANWDGVQKVQAAMAAKIAELDNQAVKNKTKTITARAQEVFDASKTKDWIFRDLFIHHGSAPPPTGLLPSTRINLITIKPGKYTEWRQAWDKYNKPIFDKLVADGVVWAYGIGTEEVRTSGDFTHFTWVSYPNLANAEKVRDSIIADRDRRTPQEREQITATFTGLTEPAASRAFVLRAEVFKIAPPPKK